MAVATLLSIAASSTSASPIDMRVSTLYARDFNCDVKNVQCCESTMSRSEAKKEFAGLLGLDGLVGNLGLNCNVSLRIVVYAGRMLIGLPLQPIGISAISSCKSTPVCCSQVHQSGLSKSIVLICIIAC